MQLLFHEKNSTRNMFIKQINKNIFQRLIILNYFKYDLIEQHRTISIINNIIFEI